MSLKKQSKAGGSTRGHEGGGATAPQKSAVYETKLAKIRLPKIQKIAICRVLPPRLKYVQPALQGTKTLVQIASTSYEMDSTLLTGDIN